ncbi:hypothetical protein, partial [Methylobacterium sp. B1]|uniref:hypothetical protein n=1 Tax=Methylobacterium sp. B1 TaxID=91459 RepID=UPI0005BA5FE7
MAGSSTITREPSDTPQDRGAKTLWYMEVAGPDDMHAVPDFWTGLAWAAELNSFIAARAAKEKWAADDNWPLAQATIRQWTWSAEQHATMLARELAERQEHAEKRAALAQQDDALTTGIKAGLDAAIRGIDATVLNMCGECSRRGIQDPETGEVSCERREDRGCACSEALELG